MEPNGNNAFGRKPDILAESKQQEGKKAGEKVWNVVKGWQQRHLK